MMPRSHQPHNEFCGFAVIQSREGAHRVAFVEVLRNTKMGFLGLKGNVDRETATGCIYLPNKLEMCAITTKMK